MEEKHTNASGLGLKTFFSWCILFISIFVCFLYVFLSSLDNINNYSSVIPGVLLCCMSIFICIFFVETKANSWFGERDARQIRLTLIGFFALIVFLLLSSYFALYGGIFIFFLPIMVFYPFLFFLNQTDLAGMVLGIIAYIILLLIIVDYFLNKNNRAFLPKYSRKLFVYSLLFFIYPAILAIMLLFPIIYWLWSNKSKIHSISKKKILGVFLITLFMSIFPLLWSNYLIKNNYQISYIYEYRDGLERDLHKEEQIFGFDLTQCNLTHPDYQTIDEQLDYYEGKLAKIQAEEYLQFNDAQYWQVGFNLTAETLGEDSNLIFNKSNPYDSHSINLEMNLDGEKIVSEKYFYNAFVYLNLSIFSVADYNNFTLDSLNNMIFFRIMIHDRGYYGPVWAHSYRYGYWFVCDPNGNIGFAAYIDCGKFVA